MPIQRTVHNTQAAHHAVRSGGQPAAAIHRPGNRPGRAASSQVRTARFSGLVNIFTKVSPSAFRQPASGALTGLSQRQIGKTRMLACKAPSGLTVAR